MTENQTTQEWLKLMYKQASDDSRMFLEREQISNNKSWVRGYITGAVVVTIATTIFQILKALI